MHTRSKYQLHIYSHIFPTSITTITSAPYGKQHQCRSCLAGSRVRHAFITGCKKVESSAWSAYNGIIFLYQVSLNGSKISKVEKGTSIQNMTIPMTFISFLGRTTPNGSTHIFQMLLCDFAFLIGLHVYLLQTQM